MTKTEHGTRSTPTSPTTSPVNRLDANLLKKLADEGFRLRREIEQRAASMATPSREYQAQARMK